MAADHNIEETNIYKPGWVKDFLVCLVFLTRLPIRLNFDFSMASLKSASRCFPLVGLITGGVAGGIFLAGSLLGLPLLLVAFFSLTAQILLTGALHEDAIGDVADGFGGGATRDKKMAIMRDSRVGTYAVVALILLIGTKASALASFTNPYVAFNVIICAAVISRTMMVWAMYLLPSARKDGLGASAGKPTLMSSIWAMILACLISIILLNPYIGSIALLAAIAGTLLMSLIAYRQIGGQTGDVLGSVQQISEAFILTALIIPLT